MFGQLRQSAIYTAGVSGNFPRVPINEHLLESRAIAAMSAHAVAYVNGGAGRGDTMRNTRAAFSKWCIVPRMLHNVETRDNGITLFGERIPAPILTAPIGVRAIPCPNEAVAYSTSRGLSRFLTSPYPSFGRSIPVSEQL